MEDRDGDAVRRRRSAPEKLRTELTNQIEKSKPDVVFAHSLGTLLTYDLFLHPPQNQIINNRSYITCGCQIGRAALRTLFGGRLSMIGAREWYNLYNENDDVLVVPFTIYAPNFQTVPTSFELPGVGDHDAVEYMRHANTQDKVWREIAGLSKSRTLVIRSRGRTAGKEKPEQVTEDVAEKHLTASVATPAPNRALLIGINDYPNPDDRLEGCVNDVFKMSATLQEIGFNAEDIRVLLNERATASAIRERFAWLLEIRSRETSGSSSIPATARRSPIITATRSSIIPMKLSFLMISSGTIVRLISPMTSSAISTLNCLTRPLSSLSSIAATPAA